MPGAVALDIAPLPPDEQADVWQASLTEPPTPAVSTTWSSSSA